MQIEKHISAMQLLESMLTLHAMSGRRVVDKRARNVCSFYQDSYETFASHDMYTQTKFLFNRYRCFQRSSGVRYQVGTIPGRNETTIRSRVVSFLVSPHCNASIAVTIRWAGVSAQVGQIAPMEPATVRVLRREGDIAAPRTVLVARTSALLQ